MSYRQVNFLHMLLLGPTMIYAGSLSKEQLGDTKNKSIDAVFSSIIVFALFIPFIVTNRFLGKIFKKSDDLQANIDSFNLTAIDYQNQQGVFTDLNLKLQSIERTI